MRFVVIATRKEYELRMHRFSSFDSRRWQLKTWRQSDRHEIHIAQTLPHVFVRFVKCRTHLLRYLLGSR